MGRDAAVAIVGAGPSGLALAIELGTRGIKCLVIERNDRVGYAPRAKTTNVRTRTHLRRWGIADRLAAAAPFGIEYPSTIRFVTRLGGFGLAEIEDASNCDPARNELYPEHGQWIPQYKLEQVLREKVDTLPDVEVMFSTVFVSGTHTDDEVIVKARSADEKSEMEFRVDYLVGADGARSQVRELVGAKMVGRYGLSRNYNIIFRAPGLKESHSHGPATMYWQVNPDLPGLIGPMDSDDIWFFMPTRLPEGFAITAESASTMIRQATGIDLAYEILSSDEWVASSLIADRYRNGRCFLIGDACHLHPPFGGYGMNMGIADGVDLGWKLAAVLQGWGGATLLDSYEIERRSIHEDVIAEAAANHEVLSNDLWSPGLEEAGPAGDAARALVGERIVAAKKREFHTLGTVLGGCYGASPILPKIGEATAKGRDGIYCPSSVPGCLAPHFWLTDGRSLYDLFGAGFSLLARDGAAPEDLASAADLSRTLNIPLTHIALSEHAAIDAYPALLTLVRPDQFVAWRGDHWENGILERAAGLQPESVG